MRVTQILERTIHEQGKPSCIRVDNGPEFISKEFNDWCESKGIKVQYTQPGKPMQNGYIERLLLPSIINWLKMRMPSMIK
jgi:putative transposase